MRETAALKGSTSRSLILASSSLSWGHPVSSYLRLTATATRASGWETSASIIAVRTDTHSADTNTLVTGRLSSSPRSMARSSRSPLASRIAPRAPGASVPCSRSRRTGCRASASSPSRRVGVPWRRPEDDDLQVLLDVVKAVLHARRDVRDAADPDRHVLPRHGEPGPARDHIVDLVLGVRLLVVDRPRRPARHG